MITVLHSKVSYQLRKQHELYKTHKDFTVRQCSVTAFCESTQLLHLKKGKNNMRHFLKHPNRESQWSTHSIASARRAKRVPSSHPAVALPPTSVSTSEDVSKTAGEEGLHIIISMSSLVQMFFFSKNSPSLLPSSYSRADTIATSLMCSLPAREMQNKVYLESCTLKIAI